MRGCKVVGRNPKPPATPYARPSWNGEGGIRTHFSSRIRIGVPRLFGVPLTEGAISPRHQHLRRTWPRINLVSTQHALLPCLTCRRWRRCARLNLEANKLRFDDPVQTARRCSTFAGYAKTITAQSYAALLDALISNKVAMWFGESCRPRRSATPA
jgi:hypothetical protein